MISRLFGEKRDQEGRNVSGYAFYATFFWGIIVSALMLIFKDQALHLLGASKATWKYADEYYTVMAWGAAFVVFGLAPNNILRTEGLALESMKASMTGTGYQHRLKPDLHLHPRPGGGRVGAGHRHLQRNW